MNSIYNGITVFCAALLLLCCISPHIPVRMAPYLSILSLGVPLIVLANFLMLLVSVLLRKRLGWISLVVMGLALIQFGLFYKIPAASKAPVNGPHSIMSFNVRDFNSYLWIDNPDVADDIVEFIFEKDPDILCLQEFNLYFLDELEAFPYHFSPPYTEGKANLAIFSKYPIVGHGILNFPQSPNNAIYADLLIKKDTIRVYNSHLHSFQVTPTRRFFGRLATGKMYGRIAHSLIKQEEQALLIRQHQSASKKNKILCGDLNNTQFSRAYHLLKGDMNDSFMERGEGMGTTFKLRFLPLRIDAILADPGISLDSHNNFDIHLSDHYPILATFTIR